MTLRIALELPLKRLIVGGMNRVFEIGRVFRNEGLDTRHNPEFTLLEAYQAFGDYHDMMDLTEAIIATSCEEAIGTTVVQIAGQDVDLKPPWRRATMAELIKENAGVEMHPSMPVAEARKIADERGVEYLDAWGSGKIMSEVYDDSSESKLVEPTFVIDHPREVSPLARAHRDDPELTERFELVVAGRELANAYSELNDPVDQAERFQDGGAAAGRRRRGGRTGRRRLRQGARVRTAADRRARDRPRPAGDADLRRRGDPRRDPLPDAAAGGRGGRRLHRRLSRPREPRPPPTSGPSPAPRSALGGGSMDHWRRTTVRPIPQNVRRRRRRRPRAARRPLAAHPRLGSV